MWKIPVHRQELPPPAPPMQPVQEFTYYPHPYHEFPTIESHVHPRFVICNSGSKLSDDLLDWQKVHETSKDDLLKVLLIWIAWNKTVPSGEFVKKLLERVSPEIEDGNSQRTASHRVLRSTRSKRKAPVEQASPTPKSSKQRALQDGGVWLDDDTLHEFSRQASSHGGLAIPKNQWIQDWLKGFSDSKCIAEVQGKLKDDRDSEDTMASGDGGHEDAVMTAGEA